MARGHLRVQAPIRHCSHFFDGLHGRLDLSQQGLAERVGKLCRRCIPSRSYPATLAGHPPPSGALVLTWHAKNPETYCGGYRHHQAGDQQERHDSRWQATSRPSENPRGCAGLVTRDCAWPARQPHALPDWTLSSFYSHNVELCAKRAVRHYRLSRIPAASEGRNQGRRGGGRGPDEEQPHEIEENGQLHERISATAPH